MQLKRVRRTAVTLLVSCLFAVGHLSADEQPDDSAPDGGFAMGGEREPKGWEIGFGAGVLGTGIETSNPLLSLFTPEIGGQQVLLVPNVSYSGERINASLQGLSYRLPHGEDDPTASIFSAGPEGFGYKLEQPFDSLPLSFGATYNPFNVQSVTGELDARFVQVSYETGFGDNADYNAWTLGSGAPLFISRKAGVFMLLTASINLESQAYADEQYQDSLLEENSLTQDWLLNPSLGVIARWEASEKWSFMGIGSYKWYDEHLKSRTDDSLGGVTFLAIASYDI